MIQPMLPVATASAFLVENSGGFAAAQVGGDFRLLDVVRAGGTAADFPLGYFHHFQIVDRREQPPRFPR